MEGFKIIKNPNQSSSKHLKAKCSKTHAEFVIRLEHDKGGWCMVYAAKFEGGMGSYQNAKSDTELKFDGGLFVGNDYACPYCGNKNIVRCGSCGCITCNDGGNYFRCEYCKNSGVIEGKITSVYIESTSHHQKK